MKESRPNMLDQMGTSFKDVLLFPGFCRAFIFCVWFSIPAYAGLFDHRLTECGRAELTNVCGGTYRSECGTKWYTLSENGITYTDIGGWHDDPAKCMNEHISGVKLCQQFQSAPGGGQNIVVGGEACAASYDDLPKYFRNIEHPDNIAYAVECSAGARLQRTESGKMVSRVEQLGRLTGGVAIGPREDTTMQCSRWSDGSRGIHTSSPLEVRNPRNSWCMWNGREVVNIDNPESLMPNTKLTGSENYTDEIVERVRGCENGLCIPRASFGDRILTRSRAMLGGVRRTGNALGGMSKSCGSAANSLLQTCPIAGVAAGQELDHWIEHLPEPVQGVVQMGALGGLVLAGYQGLQAIGGVYGLGYLTGWGATSIASSATSVAASTTAVVTTTGGTIATIGKTAAGAVSAGALAAGSAAIVYGAHHSEYTEIRTEHAKSAEECSDFATKIWRSRRARCATLSCKKAAGVRYQREIKECEDDFKSGRSGWFWN